MRKIVHIDMDAFYASIEQRDHSEWRGKPLVVGGGGKRGVVAAASYEARAFGIHSAMPTARALQLCPQLLVVPARFSVYREISRQIRAIFLEYTPLVEPLSLDEAYLDLSRPLKGPASGTLLAREIRHRIFEETGLTASAGVSFNKFLAKIASDQNKPNGQTVIPPERALAFLEELPVSKFHGVGKVTAAKMHKLGIHTGRDLKRFSALELVKHFGKSGRHFYYMVRAEDDRPVRPDRIRKSIGAERTFSEDVDRREVLLEKLTDLAGRVFAVMEKNRRYGRTLTLKMKTPEFRIFTRSRTLEANIRSEGQLLKLAEELLDRHWSPGQPLRLIGLSVSGLEEPPELFGRQLYLRFEEEE